MTALTGDAEAVLRDLVALVRGQRWLNERVPARLRHHVDVRGLVQCWFRQHLDGIESHWGLDERHRELDRLVTDVESQLAKGRGQR